MQTFADDATFRRFFAELVERIDRTRPVSKSFSDNGRAWSYAKSYFTSTLGLSDAQAEKAAPWLLHSVHSQDIERVLDVRRRLVGSWTQRSQWAGRGGYVSDSVSYEFAPNFTYRRRDSSTSGFLSGGPLMSFTISGSSGPLQSADTGIYLPLAEKSQDSFGAQLYGANERDCETLGFERKGGTFLMNGAAVVAPSGAWM